MADGQHRTEAPGISTAANTSLGDAISRDLPTMRYTQPEIARAQKSRMSDIDDMKSLLERWGVPFAEYPHEGGQRIEFGNSYDDRTLHAPTVTGYVGFVTIAEFDAEGAFQRIGAWE